MRVCDWTERGLSGGPACDRQRSRRGDRSAPRCGQLHEEIVWVLTVDERLSVQRFADLKDFPVSAGPDRRRVEAEHSREGDAAVACIAAPHAHPPVGDDELIAAARATL